MVKTFIWNPIENQIYDSSYGFQTLTTENTINGKYPALAFSKHNSSFTTTGDSFPLFDCHNSDQTNTVNFYADTPGNKVLNSGAAMAFIGQEDNYYTKIHDFTAKASVLNFLSFENESQFDINSFDNVTFHNTPIKCTKNSSFKIECISTFYFGGDFNYISTEDLSFIDISIIGNQNIDNKNSIIIDNAQINLNNNPNTIPALVLNSQYVDLHFKNYIPIEERGIEAKLSSKALIIGQTIFVNHAKIHAKDSSAIELHGEKIVVDYGGRFTVSDNGSMLFTSYHSQPFVFYGGGKQTYPKGMFYFDAPNGPNGSSFKIKNVGNAFNKNALLDDELISVNGNTSYEKIDELINFEFVNPTGNEPNYLILTMKKK